MPGRTFTRLGLVAVFCAGSALAVQQQEPVPPGLVRARESRERFEKDMAADKVKPAKPQPDWKKAQGDSDKLLALAQKIQEHVKASPDKVPAQLADELKEVQKLAKQIRQDLLL